MAKGPHEYVLIPYVSPHVEHQLSWRKYLLNEQVSCIDVAVTKQLSAATMQARSQNWWPSAVGAGVARRTRDNVRPFIKKTKHKQIQDNGKVDYPVTSMITKHRGCKSLRPTHRPER